MKIITSLLLGLFSITAFSQENIRLVWLVASNNTFEGDCEKRYLLADNVSLRSGPSKDSKVIASLPIGTELVLYEASQEMYVSSGIESQWYKTKHNGKEGWIWGGLLASYSLGSNADPSVKFLGGLIGEKFDEEWGANRRIYQIRAVRDGKEIDRIDLLTFGHTFSQLTNVGNRGVDVDDILYLHVPCDEGCGCYTGDIVVFWNEGKFNHVADLIGSADAYYSTSVGFIFPSEMEGKAGYIIKRLNDYDDSEELFEKGVILRYIEDSYWIWDGTKLVDSGLPVDREEAEVEVGY
ncbi:MAG: hypothetical protein ACI898_002179 [Flavobacteriales bacterium]|jgi:hypothetical protein